MPQSSDIVGKPAASTVSPTSGSPSPSTSTRTDVSACRTKKRPARLTYVTSPDRRRRWPSYSCGIQVITPAGRTPPRGARHTAASDRCTA